MPPWQTLLTNICLCERVLCVESNTLLRKKPLISSCALLRVRRSGTVKIVCQNNGQNCKVRQNSRVLVESVLIVAIAKSLIPGDTEQQQSSYFHQILYVWECNSSDKANVNIWKTPAVPDVSSETFLINRKLSLVISWDWFCCVEVKKKKTGHANYTDQPLTFLLTCAASRTWD